MRTIARWTAIVVGLAAGAGRAFAQAPPPRPLEVAAENLTARTTGRPAAVLPGDTVRYVLRFTNTQPIAVRNVVFDNPVPAGMRYVIGSAGADRPNVAVAYSIDGGRTYSAEPTVQRVVDGRRVSLPAPPEMYTHVRWTVQGDLNPGARVTAEFRTQLPPSVQEPSSAPTR